jgi:hypothetical protein
MLINPTASYARGKSPAMTVKRKIADRCQHEVLKLFPVSMPMHFRVSTRSNVTLLAKRHLNNIVYLYLETVERFGLAGLTNC